MTIKIRPNTEGAFPVNEDLAGLVPMAIEQEQLALTLDIQTHGQREPIVLWRGEVVDGRCRQKALLSLNHHILYKELEDNLTVSDVRIFVKSVNTRRNLSTTQKVASAAKEWKDGKYTIKKVAASWGVSSGLLDNAIWIMKNYPELLEELFNGNAVQIIDQNGKEVLSSKISAIYASLKRVKEDVVEDIQYGWKADSFIKTQAGKDWYYKICNGVDKMEVRMALAELANYKFATVEAIA